MTTDTSSPPSTAAKAVSAPLAVRAIVGTALRRVARDRLGLFFIVALPFVVILLFGVGGEEARSGLPVGVAAQGPYAGALVDALEDEDAIAVRTFGDAASLTAAVRRRDLVGGLVLESGDTTTRARWVGDPAAEAGPAARVAVDSAIAELDARLTAIRVVGERLGVPSDDARAVADAAGDEPLVAVREEDTGGEAVTFGVDEAAQNNLVLFTFITSLTGGVALIESRRIGTARRMLSTPVSSGTILLGEAAARFTIALGQALIVLVGASLLFGAQWGDPLGVAVVVALFSLVGTGAAMLFGATLSNAEQAGAIAAPLGIALGMLGGALWPLEIVPQAMQTVGRAMPHSWAIDALRTVARGGTLADVTDALAVLAGFAMVLLVLATWRLQESLRH